MKHTVEVKTSVPEACTGDQPIGAFVWASVFKEEVSLLLRTYDEWVDVRNPRNTWPAGTLKLPCHPLAPGTVITITVGDGNG